MLSETARLSSELRDMVFAKTPKGRAEVAQCSTGLNGKQRSILIVLDGQKRLSAICTMLPVQELAGVVDLLLSLDLIASQTEVAASTAPPRTATIERTRASAAAPLADAAKLLRIKSMMTHSAETRLGFMAAEVVRRLEQACDETQLLSVLGHWHMAMRESKYGKDVATIYLEQIKASFRGEDMIAPPPPTM